MSRKHPREDKEDVPYVSPLTKRTKLEGLVIRGTGATSPLFASQGSRPSNIQNSSDKLQQMIASLQVQASRPQPRRSNYVDWSIPRQLLIDARSIGGQLQVAPAFLGEAARMKQHLAMGTGRFTTLLPCPELVRTWRSQGKQVVMDCLEQLGLLNASIRTWICDYVGQTSVYVGLLHYPESNYVNVAGIGSTPEQVQTLARAKWNGIEVNRIIETPIVEQVPPAEDLVMVVRGMTGEGEIGF